MDDLASSITARVLGRCTALVRCVRPAAISSATASTHTLGRGQWLAAIRWTASSRWVTMAWGTDAGLVAGRSEG